MLRAWDTNFHPTFAAGRAVYLQISELIATEIRRGRLQPGTALPGTRELAKQLGVNRKTAVLAYEELLAQGWLEAQTTCGTFVSSQLPESTPMAFAPAAGSPVEAPGFRWQDPFEPEQPLIATPGALVFNDGTPDARLAPVATLASAYRRVMQGRGRRNQLGYDSPLGSLSLREALSRMLNQDRGLSTTPASICLTRGTQMALYLTARLLLQPGDVVAVENPGYPRPGKPSGY
jgi:GntR family transcriptional regulator/MocR family aminotransferase